MKKYLSCILLIGFVLSMCACGENATLEQPNAAVSESKPESGAESSTESDASTLEGFLSGLDRNAKYKSYKMQRRSRDDQYEEFRLEIYTTENYTYYSLIDKVENMDVVIRCSPTSSDDSVEVLYNSKWIECTDNRLSLMAENFGIIFDAALSEDDTTDSSIEINGEKFESKRGLREYISYGYDRDAVYVDFLFRNGKWGSFVISDATVQSPSDVRVLVICEDFVFSDAPSEDGRLYACLNAPTDNQIVAYEMISGSMSPAMELGKMYFFRKTDASSLKVGDIVLARYSDAYCIAHRIVEIKDDGTGFILRGDRNSQDDEEVYPPQNIIGILIEN